MDLLMTIHSGKAFQLATGHRNNKQSTEWNSLQQHQRVDGQHASQAELRKNRVFLKGGYCTCTCTSHNTACSVHVQCQGHRSDTS